MKYQRQDGYGMVELMIVLGLTGLIAGAGFALYNFTGRFANSTQDRYTERSIARHISDNISCERLPISCKVGEGITFYDRFGKVMISSRGTKMRNYTLQAICTGKKSFVVHAAKLDRQKQIVKDSLTGAKKTWMSDKTAIFTDRSLCTTFTGNDEDAESGVQILSGKPCLVTNRSLLPCEPSWPEACPKGYVNSGTSRDSFGGETESRGAPIFGMRYIRYCIKEFN